jgi:hypothetical protein
VRERGAELATLIAAHTTRPREAKKIVANIFTAPTWIAPAVTTTLPKLAPAANRSERLAIAKLFAALTECKLTLPGDAKRLPLRFEIQPSREQQYELWRARAAGRSVQRWPRQSAQRDRH